MSNHPLPHYDFPVDVTTEFTVFCSSDCGREIACCGFLVVNAEDGFCNGDIVDTLVNSVDRHQGVFDDGNVVCNECVRKAAYYSWREETVEAIVDSAAKAGWNATSLDTGTSSYVTLNMVNEEGDTLRPSLKIRVSDHQQKYDADFSVEFDGNADGSTLADVLKAIA